MTSIYENNNGFTVESMESGMVENKPVETSLAATLIEQGVESEVNQRFLKTWRKLFANIKTEMGRSRDRETLLNTTVKQIHEKIVSDRTLVYRFVNSETGVVASEYLNRGWTPAMGENLPAIVFGGFQSCDYQDAIAINQIAEIDATPYQRQLLEKFQIQSSLAVPVYLQGQIWGLLVVHQCQKTRIWSESEISLLTLVADELGDCLQILELKQQQQLQAQEYKSLTKVIDKIQRASSLEQILQTATQEARQLINCDRVSVYQFNPDWSGEYVAESVAAGWTPLVGGGIKTVWEDTYLQETQGGRYRHHESMIVNDIYAMGFSPCHIDLLEQFQVRAYITVPVFSGQKLWGILAGYQNSETRTWKESEIELFKHFASSLGVAVSQQESLQKMQIQAQQQAKIATQEKAIAKLISRIRQSVDIKDILTATTQEVRQLLSTQRVGVYRFNPDWSGDFVAESAAPGLVPLMDKGLEKEVLQQNGHCQTLQGLAKIYNPQDNYLQNTQGGRYQQKTTFVVNDVEKAGFPNCYMHLLEQLEAKAYITAPIFNGEKLWGLLTAYHSEGARDWQESEINLIKQVAVQFGTAISQAEYIQQTQAQAEKLAKTAKHQQDLIALTRKIGEALVEKVTNSSQLETILQTTVAEVRRLLQTDRTVIYRFNPDWSGDFIAESVSAGWLPFQEKLQNQQIDQALLKENGHCDSIRSLTSIYKQKDSYLQDHRGGRYQQKTTFVVNNVAQENFPACYTELLDQFEAKAYLTVPIFKGDQLWGLLASYQHSRTREWQEVEINVMQQIAVLVAVAMQQAQTYQKLEAQTKQVTRVAELDLAATKVIDKIRQSIDINEIFSITTKEVRGLLNTDRVAIYRFNADWGGVFVAESIAPGWVSLVEKQNQIPQLQENISNCFGAGGLLTASDKAQGKQVKDTYLQATQARELRDRNAFVRSDIHNSGFSQCYVDVLDEYQAKAYVIVPIFQGEKLWGMLAAFENKGTREWEELEVSLLTRIANQLGTTLQQAEYLETLQQQSAQLSAAAEREKQNTEKFQKQAMQLLAAVRPALDGDLTVRAPITEDVLGTIADAYNNTLQALRQIVGQVLGAAEQVAARSNESNASLSSLTGLARQQSKEINEALMEIQQMVDSTQAVVDNAEIVQTTVKQASQTVEKGDAAMNKTVQAIQAIRETVAQTSKKIKRLSESSQKISKVVNLISNFATQTNVLALNAAIEATRAGEYGKGFAVVADEVRSLSRQSAAATIEIEKLVQEIQEETGEVAVAMETGIQQVVEGTNLVSETRQSLNEIVTATEEISELLHKITEATQGQMMQSVSVTASMKDVAQIANKTSSETNNIAVVFQQLSEMAEELLNSTSKFKVN